jgi:ribose transport system ATP-binding protein
MSVIELNNIGKRYGATVALDSVNFRLLKGEVHALIGENGAGKSTLMNVLAGLTQPETGSMSIQGEPYSPASPLDARRHGIALIHQELSLCPDLTVAENILLGAEPSQAGWLNHREARRLTLDVLKNFHHPEIRPERRVSELSIAARQVVEICRALAAQASIILMDEPTSSLQREDIESLFALIRHLRRQGISVIYISHFLEEVREIADRFTVLRDGKSISTGRIDSISDDQLISQMVGRAVENLYPKSPGTSDGEVVLEARDLIARGLKRISFELRRGEILGIAGLMGAGRTELVRALFGLEPIESGSIRLHAHPGTARSVPPARRIAQGVGYLSEDRNGEGLALALSVADNITLTQFQTCSRWGWLDVGKQQRQAIGWIKRLSIKARDSYQPTGSLSGGNQQKVALARLLHQDSDILLLDEPTRGIDIGSKAQIYEAIARAAASNKAVLFVSSYLPELFGMCDRLAVMSRGRLSPGRPINEWTPESVMQAAIGWEAT